MKYLSMDVPRPINSRESRNSHTIHDNDFSHNVGSRGDDQPLPKPKAKAKKKVVKK